MRFGFALRLNAIWPPPRHGMSSNAPGWDKNFWMSSW
jgi:hypothetical protein